MVTAWSAAEIDQRKSIKEINRYAYFHVVSWITLQLVGRRAAALEGEAIMPGTLLVDTIAAARQLGLSKSTLEKLRVYGGGPRYLKLGRSVRYRSQDLEIWISERVLSNTSQALRVVSAEEVCK